MPSSLDLYTYPTVAAHAPGELSGLFGCDSRTLNSTRALPRLHYHGGSCYAHSSMNRAVLIARGNPDPDPPPPPSPDPFPPPQPPLPDPQPPTPPVRPPIPQLRHADFATSRSAKGGPHVCLEHHRNQSRDADVRRRVRVCEPKHAPETRR